MALDTSGNIAVDFVWGNMPLQPNTQRAEGSTEDVTSAIVYLQANGATPAIYVSSAFTGLTLNDTITVQGTGTSWDRDWTVAYVQSGSPSGQVIGVINNGVNIVDLGITPGPAVPAGAVAVKSVSGNFGGGTGDKGWSKTTKKKSEQLDPTLDGHNIAIDFWNNFPDHTPNAGFVPQEVFRFTSKAGSLYAWSVEPDYTTDEYYARGYSFNLNSSVISEEELLALKELSVAGALLAQRVPSFTITDSYGNVTTVQEGFIAGVDVTPMSNMYGPGETYTFAIKVAVPDYVPFPSSPLYPAPGTEIVLGVGTPKQIVATGTVGVDMVSAAFQASPGSNGQWYVYGTNWNTLNPNDFIGGYISTDELSDDPNANMYLSKWELNKNIMKIGGVQFTDAYGQPFIDMYGNSYVIITSQMWTNNSLYSVLPSYASNEGSRLVVIK